MITAEHERDLIIRAQAGDDDATAALLESHDDQICRCATKIAGDDDDAIQEARIVALNVIRGFDPSRGFRLAQSLGMKIGWGVTDALRRNSGLIHVPRNAMGTEVGKRLHRVGRLDAPVGDGGHTFGQSLIGEDDFEEDIERREAISRVAWAVSKLPTRSAKMVRARLDGESLKVAGRRAGISESRACQLEPEINQRLELLITCKTTFPKPETVTRFGNARPLFCETTGRTFPTLSAYADFCGYSVAQVCQAIRRKGGNLFGRRIRYADQSPRQPVTMSIDPRARGVVHVGTNRYFHSITAAAKAFNIPQPTLWKSLNMGRMRGDVAGEQFVFAVEKGVA
jgi:RNA polymerase sigma factor (sigma-70 family)